MFEKSSKIYLSSTHFFHKKLIDFVKKKIQLTQYTALYNRGTPTWFSIFLEKINLLAILTESI